MTNSLPSTWDAVPQSPRPPLAKIGLWLCFITCLVLDAVALYIVLTYWRYVLG